jgi:hypothetical protein
MGDADTDAEEQSGVTAVYRTLGEPFRSRPDAEMDVIGWSLFLGMLILLVPLLPFLVLVYLISRGLDALKSIRS